MDSLREESPPQLRDLPLKRPILGPLHQPMPHRIRPRVFPLRRIAFAPPQLRIPMPTLPNRFTQLPRHQRLPVAHPPSRIVQPRHPRPAKQVKMLRQNHVFPHPPLPGSHPSLAKHPVHFRRSQHPLPPLRANRQKHNDRRIAPLDRRQVHRPPAADIVQTGGRGSCRAVINHPNLPIILKTAATPTKPRLGGSPALRKKSPAAPGASRRPPQLPRHLIPRKLVDPPLMPTALKFRPQPDVHDVQRDLDRRHPLPDRQNIRVIVHA